MSADSTGWLGVLTRCSCGGGCTGAPRVEGRWQDSKQCGCLVAAAMSTLNAHAAEWKATADVLDGKFTEVRKR